MSRFRIIAAYALVLSALFAGRSGAAIPSAEREALIALYNSTDGLHWTNRSNWLGMVGSECSWFGVTCRPDQSSVTMLKLGVNRLSGTLPPELGDLTGLEVLWLQQNQLSGELPPEVGNLSNLRSLVLSSNQLGGPFPVALTSLPRLAELYLSDNEFYGSIPPALGNAVSLNRVWLGHNQFTGVIPRELGNLSQLEDLELASNQLSGEIPAELGNLGRLTSLLLYDNQLSGSIPSTLGNLSRLQYLILGSNRLGGLIPPELGALSNLLQLELYSNELSGEIPPALGNLAMLESLGLSHNHLSGPIPGSLGNLSSLWRLNFRSNQLSGDVPAELASLTRVCSDRCLFIDYNALDASDPAVIAWATAREPDWRALQTLPPTNVSAAAVSPTSVRLRWTPIAFTAYTGAYEVWGDAGFGPYYAGGTSSKSATEVTLSGIAPDRSHTFVVRTVSAPNVFNPRNTVTSAFSDAVVVTTSPLTISISDSTLEEGDAGSRSATFTVSLSEPSTLRASVVYEPAALTATEGADFVRESPRILSFSPGETSKTIQVRVNGDLIDEPDETFAVNLSSPDNVTIHDAQGIATILDDDAPPSFSVADSVVSEGDAGSVSVHLTVSIVRTSSVPVSVLWSSADGTATKGTDYVSATGTVTIPPGEASTTIAVPILGDVTPEGTEYFFVNLFAPSNASIVDGQAFVTIMDEEGEPLAIPDPVIAMSGCAYVAQHCALTVGSASGSSLASWTYEWKLDGVLESILPSLSPSFSLPGSHVVELRVSNTAGTGVAVETLRIEESPTVCPAEALCALGGRFQISLRAIDPRSAANGAGVPLQKNDLFGYFSIPALTSNPGNPEVFVKMLDGRPVNGSYWLFFGGLTDFEYTLYVKDTIAGSTRTYTKKAGSSQGGFDVGNGAAMEDCPNEVDGVLEPSISPALCDPDSTGLCLNGSRFRVSLAARDHRTGTTGPGRALPESDLFGYFSIPNITHNAENPEVFVKVLDGRAVNGFWWIFYSGLTDLEYTLTVTDTITGTSKRYTKPARSSCGAFDVDAF